MLSVLATRKNKQEVAGLWAQPAAVCMINRQARKEYVCSCIHVLGHA